MRADYSYAAVMEFDDVESLKTYLAHDAHEALGAAFFECFEEALIYDYELAEATDNHPLLGFELALRRAATAVALALRKCRHPDRRTTLREFHPRALKATSLMSA